MLIVGGTSSDKTTFANAVINETAHLTPNDRIIIIEDTPEIVCKAENAVLFTTSLNVSMQDFLKVCMRVRPDRIIIGETKEQEALALVKAWNTGHSGDLSTVHANSAEDGLKRVYSLIAESSINSKTIPDLILEAINLVIFMTKEKNGIRRIKDIVKMIDFKDNNFFLLY